MALVSITRRSICPEAKLFGRFQPQLRERLLRHAVLTLFFCSLLAVPRAAGSEPLFVENFATLAQWDSLKFPKIPRHSTYRISTDEAGKPLLVLESDNAASGLLYRGEFNLQEYPIIRWRWKVVQGIVNADPTKKAGDDYAVRMYLVFKYDPASAGIVDRIAYAGYKATYGEYPPHSSLNYVWASGEPKSKSFPSPYTKRSQMIVLQTGASALDQWQEEEVNALEDYRRLFGEDPPASATLAVMTDSDNTGQRTQAAIQRIEVTARRTTQ